MVTEIGTAPAQKILGNAIRNATIAQARIFADRDGPDRNMRDFQALYGL